MTNGIQNQVNVVPAVGVAGDFCSVNPRASALAGPGALVAGPNGVVVGRFAWISGPVDGDGNAAYVNNFGHGSPTGFVFRNQQALITQYLADASMVIQKGFGVTLMIQGDFWAKNEGTTQALPGQKAYANFLTGAIRFGATGTAATAAVTAQLDPATNAFTASIAGNILTVSALGSGNIYRGTVVSGAGVASGTKITSQISGTPNGVGVYTVSIPEQSIASEAMTGTYALFTVSAVASGVVEVGGIVGTLAVAAGTTIRDYITGAGGVGTYAADPTQTVGSGSATVTTEVETNWYARSSGLQNELVKMSTWAQG